MNIINQSKMKNKLFTILVLVFFNYITIAQTPCLIASYNFNGNTIDNSGNGHDLKVFGATLTKNRFGKDNKAYHFDGGDYLWTVADTQFSKSEFSTSFWAKPESSADARILTVGPEKTFWHYYCNTTVSGKFSWIGHTVTGNYSFYNSASSTFATNTWTQVICTYKTDTVKIFINGKLSSTLKINDKVVKFTTKQLLQIGAAYHPDAPVAGFVGDIDDVRIYCNALSSKEVSDVYNEESNPLEISQLTIIDSKLKIYPNPAHNYISIEYDLKSDLELYVKLINNNGQLVKSMESINGSGIATLDVKSLKPGLYYINFCDESGGILKAKKIIIY